MSKPVMANHFYRLSPVIIVLLIGVVSLFGCVYPATEIPGLTAQPITPGSTNIDPPTTSLSPPIISPSPTVIQASPTFQPSAIPELPTPTPVPPAKVPAQYHLDVIFDYEQHSLAVQEDISTVNLSHDTLTDFVLIVEPNLIPDGFTLISITWDSGANIDHFTLSNNLLKIPLLQPLQPREQISLHIEYRLDIPYLGDTSIPGRPVAYGYSERQTNLVDWYPYLPPYASGEGWLVHSPWYLGEYQVYDDADYYVSITLAQPIQGLVLAASAPAVQDGEHYIYELPSARAFAFSASAEYLVQTNTIGAITVYSYSFPYDEAAGRQVLYDTSDAVQIYSELFYPYPRSSLSIVEADFLDGMEYDGLFFLSHGFYDLYDGTPKGYLTFIAAHETAHQWWYGLVSNDQAVEPWLDEALCTYMEHIYYEYISYDYQHHRENALVNWWWSYRVNFFEPQGWVDSSIYDFDNSRAYRDAIYLNGAKFLDDLRSSIGDEAFFAFLKNYATTYANSIATADDFFTVLRNETEVNLDPLISSYFKGH